MTATASVRTPYEDRPARPAPTERPVNDVVRHRWSTHAFAPRPVDREDVLSLFEAARWAPSSYNEQPWFFVVASSEDEEAFERIASTLAGPNQVWARTAPLLAISVARTRFERNGKPNRHAFHDVGLAVGNLLAEATARGLSVHQMAGFDAERAHEVLGLADGHEAVAAIAIGHPGNPEDLPADLRDRETAPRRRRSLSETLFSGTWGSPFPAGATRSS